MSQSTIRSLLMTRLDTWASAHSPVVTIAREGVPFTKPTDKTAFIEAILIPSSTVNRSTDGTRQTYYGELAINIWTKNDIGPKQGEDLAEEIKNLFPVVPKSILPVSIESTPSIHKAILDDSGWRIIPVSIMYRAEF